MSMRISGPSLCNFEDNYMEFWSTPTKSQKVQDHRNDHHRQQLTIEFSTLTEFMELMYMYVYL